MRKEIKEKGTKIVEADFADEIIWRVREPVPYQSPEFRERLASFVGKRSTKDTGPVLLGRQRVSRTDVYSTRKKEGREKEIGMNSLIYLNFYNFKKALTSVGMTAQSLIEVPRFRLKDSTGLS